MKHSYLGAACIVAVTAVSAPAFAASGTGAGSYDPLALDRFIAQSMAEATALAAPAPSAIDLMQSDTPTIVAQETARFDSEGYLIGPDGKRVEQPLRPRWRVGVFR